MAEPEVNPGGQEGINSSGNKTSNTKSKAIPVSSEKHCLTPAHSWHENVEVVKCFSPP